MNTELRTPAEVGAWLAAGLMLRRVFHDDSDEDVIARAIVACAHELPSLPPPGMIADVAILLGGARLPLLEPMTGAVALRAAIRAYDDDVLSRLVVNAKYDDLVAAYAHVAVHDRAAATALVVGAICERARFSGTPVSGPALRRALARPREERIAAGRAEIAGGPIIERLAEAYDALARSARHAVSLVEDRDVFAVDHLAVLRDFGGRMTADHIARAAEAFTRELPRRLPARRLHRGGSETKLADDVVYPAGGFTAITPGGANAAIENLVASELVYMEDGPEPDAFTLRFVEGELLFYTRDDSELRRHRHVITFVLGGDLDDARVKDHGLPWQRLVLVLGLLLASVRWLADKLGDQALAIRVVFPPQSLDEERGILGILLEAEIARGVVSIVEEPAPAAIGAAAKTARTAITDVVTVASGASPEVPAGLRATHVAVQAREWRGWCEASEDLLRWLV
jgi:hypothetical protein